MRPASFFLWIIRLSLVFSVPFPFHKRSVVYKSDLLGKRPRRSNEVIDCISMASTEGDFTYRSDGLTSVCGIYFISPPESLIEIEFSSFNINCKSGLAVVVDGWEMNQQFFPSPEDHDKTIDDRLENLCGQRPSKTFVSSQNVALIQHLVAMPGEGFTVRVRFRKNPQPCNIISMFKRGLYTVKNYGAKRNCSVSIIYPERVRLLSVDVGVTGHFQKVEAEYGIKSNCHSYRGTDDYVELAGGNGFEIGFMNVRERFCGLESNVGNEVTLSQTEQEVLLGCQHSSVRLVSSGQFFNSVTFLYSNLTEDEIGREDPNKCIA